MTDIEKLKAIRAIKSHCIKLQKYELSAFLRDKEKILQGKCGIPLDNRSHYNEHICSLYDINIDQGRYIYEIIYNSHYGQPLILEEIDSIIRGLIVENRNSKIDQII